MYAVGIDISFRPYVRTTFDSERLLLYYNNFLHYSS